MIADLADCGLAIVIADWRLGLSIADCRLRAPIINPQSKSINNLNPQSPITKIRNHQSAIINS